MLRGYKKPTTGDSKAHLQYNNFREKPLLESW
jgi:hypothetical protein